MKPESEFTEFGDLQNYKMLNQNFRILEFTELGTLNQNLQNFRIYRIEVLKFVLALIIQHYIS